MKDLASNTGSRRDGSGRAARLRGRNGELRLLRQLIDAVRSGNSRVLVLSGEAGVGKTALMDYVASHAPDARVVRAVGVQSEMELPYAGLHQLCGAMLDSAIRLPAPQRAALRTAFGLHDGPAPDRLLVGLAVLSLLSEAAAERPIICLVDDQQWLDTVSAQALAFAARRLAADPVGVIFSTRERSDDLTGFDVLALEGLQPDDAFALLDSVLAGPLDSRVRDRLVAETRGNPLALLELPRDLTPAELAGGFGLPAAQRISRRIEETFSRQIQVLPEQSRRLVQLASADSTGDAILLWRAAEALGIPTEAGHPAQAAGLIEVGYQVRFRHPLVRSAAYQSTTSGDRQVLHRALATVADPSSDPDRRAWHLAQAAAGPDEAVAAELERSAGRAQRRGGIAAAGAFLERAASLTPDPSARARRLLAAARSKADAGALDAALSLLIAAETDSDDLLHAAEAEFLRGQIALERRRGEEAARLLLNAARRLQSVDVDRARAAHLDALVAAMWAGDMRSAAVRDAATAAQSAPAAGSPRVLDVLLDAVSLRIAAGYEAAQSGLSDALRMVLEIDVTLEESDRWLWLAGGRIGQLVAMELWDDESWHSLATRQVEASRKHGALMHLTFALNYLARIEILAGNLGAATRLVEEDQLIAEATGNPWITDTLMMLAAWRGQAEEAARLIEATSQQATVSGAQRLKALADYASAVLHNGLGHGEAARAAAAQAFHHEPFGYGSHIVPELAEAAARTNRPAILAELLEWVSSRARSAPSDWLRGIESRVRAFTADGEQAEQHYLESIECLGRTSIRAQQARGHLLYGEWLRRENRRADAREQLRVAHSMLEAMGIGGFAERARRELVATGETVRRRHSPSAPSLTPQELQVAQLAREGMSNPEIGARMFISPRTVQYHLSKVFSKLDITSRTQLHRVLPPGLDIIRP